MQHRKVAFKKKILWTLCCFCIYLGFILILLWTGIAVNDSYQIAASQGDSTEIVPTPIPGNGGKEWTLPWEERGSIDQQIVSIPVTVTPTAVPLSTQTPFPTPEIVVVNPETNTPASTPQPEAKQSLITRIIIPSVAIDRKVVQIGWHIEENTEGISTQIWDVDKFRVGHHIGTANPGEGGNIVLAGHSGGTGYPFNDLFWVKPGEKVTLYEGDKRFPYRIVSRQIVDQEGVSLEQQAKNAKFIEPTDHEVITMIACWPLTGPDKFTQRVIVRAEPDILNK